MNLMEDYKKEPGGKEKLKERNPKWINDDYVKFMRFGQHFIDKNGSGILAFINPHGFLDNPTFRGMRWNLLKTYDKIYTIDLHGNSKKKETAPDGSIDQNVFDIMQGVSINFFIKTGKKKTNDLAEVFHYDLFGKRDLKYDFLSNNSLKTIEYKKIPNIAPNYFLVNKDFDVQEVYNKGIKINDLFTLNNVGIVTARDKFTIHETENDLINTIEDFLKLDDETARIKYNLGNDVRDWQVNFARKDLINHYPNNNRIVNISYRPFEDKKTFYTGKSKGFHCYPRNEVMQHFIKGNNYGITTIRINKEDEFSSVFITKNVIDARLSDRFMTSIFPLYIYPEPTTQQSLLDEVVRTPNLNLEIVNEIAEKLGIPFVAEKKTTPPVGHPSTGGEFTPLEFAPIDILDYIYAVLHSPSYREKYKEFLKIDFPRVPYPSPLTPEGGVAATQVKFWKLVALGSQLRQIHLLESEVLEKLITQYPEDGTNVVVKPRFVNSPLLEGCPQGGVVQDVIINSSPIYFNPKLDLPCNIKLKPRAKELRQAENLSEVLFWMQVTKGQFYNIDFDRQRIIGNYIVDFYVKKLGLIIEIDGSSHDNKQEYDAERDAYFESLGLKVYHIPVVEVLQQMKIVMKKLEDYIIENYNLPPHPSGTLKKEGNFGSVYINETQYFANVPEIAWNFYIGGYQPAQKWLKDRKDRELSYEDILHYQKIIVALCETNRLMREIDKIDV